VLVLTAKWFLVLLCGSRWGTGLGRFIARYHWRALPLGHALTSATERVVRDGCYNGIVRDFFFLKNFIGSLTTIFTIIILTNNWAKIH
jgi:hypothetical protein